MKRWLTAALLLTHLLGRAEDGGGAVHRLGRLQVKGGQLCSQAGEPVQLRGMSSHDLKYFPFGTNTVRSLARDWGATVVRASMYVDSYGSSYIRQPKVKESVKQIVDAAIQNDLYVLVDWHILQDGNPNQYRPQAKAFFEEMAGAYGKTPNVMYEICNEPNGTNVTWKEIRDYAQFVIPAIRAIAPDSVVIVGTERWSQGVKAAAEDPLPYPNILYALHFYAGTHKEPLRKDADYALSKGAAIFVSEWGLTDYTGRGKIHPDEAQAWMTWMNSHKISWANWSLSNAGEGSAALKPWVDMDGPWKDTDLTASGAWVKKAMSAP